MKKPTISLAATLAALLVAPTMAADTVPASFNPLQTFAPYAYPQPATAYRSASGVPGPLYWQNRADYRIEATLDPITRQLSGSEVITYTRMQVTLPTALEGHGGQLKLHIRWDYTVPGEFGGRTDVNANPQGDIFEIAQWYPRLCVYDDLHGWDTQPYLNSEFYLEYGDVDYRITVPSSMLVVGSGELLNPREVLSPTERARLDQARDSDATVMIRTAAEVDDPASRPKHGGTLTWHFTMKNTRDVAFGASAAYLWDAARINLPDGKTALAMSAYPVESAGDQAWGVATQNLKKSVEFFSRTYYPYPYPVAINETGTAGGMEYPGITFDHKEATGADLRLLIAHEIGHTWFPMIVGSNERRDAWMDEGLDTFVDVYEAEAFDDGKFAPKRDGEYAPGNGTPAEQIAAFLKDVDAPPPLTRADAIPEKYRHPITYFKAAFGLVLLREEIIGPDRFDPAFRRYIATWAGKHPGPSDFFRFMESETGEDLGWFWRGWFEHNWQFDLAVQKVTYTDGDYHKGVDVTVANLDQLVLPATLELAYDDGSVQNVRVPWETWLQHHRYVIHVDGTRKLESAVIDPVRALPDSNRANNTFAMP